MKKPAFAPYFIMCILLMGLSPCIDAGTPLWTFTPWGQTTLTIYPGTTRTVQYTVTNMSSQSRTLVMQSMVGLQQITTMGECPNPFTLAYLQSCRLTLVIDGSLLQGNIVGGPVIYQANSDGTPNVNLAYQPSPKDRLNITLGMQIESDLSALALSVKCPTSDDPSCLYNNTALTGKPRRFRISNTSTTKPVLDVHYVATSLPAGTLITPNSCNIAPGGFCDFTVTPGPTASTGPVDVEIFGSNTNSLSLSVNVLTYGSEYQSGYVFDVDDSPPPDASVGGKVLALQDQSSAVAWEPGCPSDACMPIAANDNFDGLANTTHIANALSSIPASSYAAGNCYAISIGGYTNWYLPAICEMGYGSDPSSACGDQTNPTLQNIQSNLVDNSIIPLSGAYWSSTQYDLQQALYNQFDIAGLQAGDYKDNSFSVRCIRQMS